MERVSRPAPHLLKCADIPSSRIITAFKGKRDGNQYENWACEYENGYDGTCTNGNVVNPVVTQIGQTDMDDSVSKTSKMLKERFPLL
jgi:hypothetical protein